MTPSHPAISELRRVRWKPIDRALDRYATESLNVLLQAALASPGCVRFHDHLLLLLTRTLRAPFRDGAVAEAGDLAGLVDVAVRAAPGRGVVTGRDPGDVRGLVRYPAASGARLLVHPGQLAHPLLVLRALQQTARAVDQPLGVAAGFGITDLVDLVMHVGDRTLSELAPAWPSPELDVDRDMEGEISCRITPAEVAAAAGIATADPSDLPDRCSRPVPARRVLQWMTRRVKDLPLRYDPETPLLGPVLALTAHGRHIPVPPAVATDALAPAVSLLLKRLPAAELAAAEERMQALTVARLARLLRLNTVPDLPPTVCRLTSPTHRYDIAVVSAIADGTLGARIEEGRAALADTPADRGRLVVYGGPSFLGPELITDTVYLHVEEVAEILADVDGDMTLLALFVLELTHHPGVTGVFYHDALDAWSLWHREGTLLLPGPDRDDVAVVPAARRDEVWERAAAHAETDVLLDAAGLPDTSEFPYARLVPPLDGATGVHADLDHIGTERALLVRTATRPAVVIAAVPDPAPGSVLGASAMAGFSDSLRTTLTSLGAVTAHATLPGSVPLVIQVTAGREDHQLHDRDLPDRDPEPLPEGEWLRLRAGIDPDTGHIGISVNTALLKTFTGDGRQGHDAVGRLLHHLIAQVRSARNAGPGTSVEVFTAEWNSTHPLLHLIAAANSWPAVAPQYRLPDSRHVHTRARRTAAAAVRTAGVPAGTWDGAEACRPGGPAEQLLNALENALAEQIRSYQPDLSRQLAQQLNAAWSTRTRGRDESAVNLTTSWAADWKAEAEQRQRDTVAATSALHLLVQQTLLTEPAGTATVDILALADLVALAELVLAAGITAVSAARRLHELHLRIDPSGVFTLTEGPDDGTGTTPAQEGGHLGFDAGAYHRAHRARVLAHEGERPELLDAAQFLATGRARTPSPYTPPRLPPGSHLATADRLLQQHWGCSLAHLGAVLATAANWPTGPEETAAVTPGEIVARTATWTAQSEQALHAAVSCLTLHPGNAAGPGAHAYTEVERRSRPLTHPFITDRGQLLILPWLAHAAHEAFGAYLDDGRLPHPELPVPVAQALERHRQQLDRRLEHDVEQAARTAGLPHRFRLLEKTAAQFGIPGLAGEIDLLVADPHRRRLWVIEAKNPTGAVAPHAVRQHIQKFTTRYRDKLLAKAATITAHTGQAAALCDVTDLVDWRVVPLMVTRTVELAAFVADPRIPYTVADHLAAVLIHPTDPAPGWIPGPVAERG